MHTYNVISYAKQKLLKNRTWAFVLCDEVSPVLAGCNSGGGAHGGGGCGEAGGGERMMTLTSGFPTSSGHGSKFQLPQKAVRDRGKSSGSDLPSISRERGKEAVVLITDIMKIVFTTDWDR